MRCFRIRQIIKEKRNQSVSSETAMIKPQTVAGNVFLNISIIIRYCSMTLTPNRCRME